MSAEFITVKSYSPSPVNRKEILRYAGCTEDTAPPFLDECIDEVIDKLTYKACYRSFDISVSEGVIDLGFAKTNSADLAKNLNGCHSIVLFGATVGIEIDRMINKYSRLSPSKALLLQAIGAERIESLCDELCLDISRELEIDGNFLRPRFSPGYGDFPIEIQKKIFAVLDCSRHIGLTLNDSMVMSPSKSVTAIIGVGRTPMR